MCVYPINPVHFGSSSKIEDMHINYLGNGFCIVILSKYISIINIGEEQYKYVENMIFSR